MTAPSPQRSSATAATATTWNPTQQHTIAEYFVKYNMETIPESLNGELPPIPSGSPLGSWGHTYNHNGHNQNLHVPKRSNTHTASTSTSQNKHQRYAAAESQTQERPSSSLSRSFTSPLSSPSPSDSGSRMIGGGKSTQRVKEWVIKRSNSSRESKSKTAGRSSSSNSGHQTLEIIHLGGGRVEHESNSHVHSSSLSSNFLAPTSQQTRASVANSIDSRVTQWSDLYHDPPESLTVITKPATATGKPSRPASPEPHERPQLRELGLGWIGSGHNGGRDHEFEGQGHQSRHRHTKSDGSIHPAPLRVPSNPSSSTSSSVDKKEGQGGFAAAVVVPEETWKPQGLTRSDSKWKPLPVPPPPGAPGSVTPLVSQDGGRRAEDNINMTGAIGVSPLTSSVESESEFGEREDSPPRERQQGAPHIVNVMVQRSGSRAGTRDKPSPPPTSHSSNDVSALGFGYAVGLGVLSPPLTPPQREAVESMSGSGAIRESIWPVPPSYSLSLSQSGQQFSANAPSRSATAPPPEKQRQHQHQHQQKPSTSSSLASTSTLNASFQSVHQHQHQQKPSTSSSLASTSTLNASSSQSVLPTHVIPKRSDSLSYSRTRRPQQHAPGQLSKSTSSSSLRERSTEKIGPGHSAFTDFDLATATTATATAGAPTPPLQQHKLHTPTVTPPTPIVQVPLPRGTTPTPTPTPTTPIWSPRACLSSRELLWLHRNYRGITAFMAAWGLSKGLSDDGEREEGLGIMRALMAAEISSSSSSSSARIETGRQPEEDEDDDEHRDGGEKKGGGGGGDNSWLDFSPGPGPAERNINMKADVDVDEKGNEKEGANGYAALKGQGVRMKPRGAGASDKEGRYGTWRKEEEEEGSGFI